MRCIGQQALMNFFDTVLIVADVLQIIVEQAGAGNSGGPVSLLRFVRLFRSSRLLRLMSLGVFSDFFAMIMGLIGGLTTLASALVLFVLIVYMTSLVFRELFGRRPLENIFEYFDSVPRSMFTIFRCSFGDCNSITGVPIFEFVNVSYGGFYSLLYCSLMFLVTVGLFNVISAIFVESTMQAAQQLVLAQKQIRLDDTKLWKENVSTLMKCFMDHCDLEPEDTADVKNQLEKMMAYPLEPDLFGEWIKDERVIYALKQLDIEPDDHAYLFDILDCDNSGQLFVVEVIDGISRLRGESRRSDIITIDLMIRSIQSQCDSLVKGMNQLILRK